jgi:hypothetical protein
MTIECARVLRGLRLCGLTFALLASVGVAGSAAGGQAAAPAAAAQAKLKAAIEARFRAFATRDGIVLVPRRSVAGVGSIEIADGTIGVDGSVVSGAELRQRLGADADVVIELSYLDPAARRALLLGAAPAPPAPPAAPPPPEAVPAPAPPAPEPVEQGRRRSEARVRIGGPVRIERDEVVDGAVVAVFGSATVEGEVRDDVVSVFGNVRLGPDATVRGAVTVVGGRLEADPRARVGGEVNEIGFDMPRLGLKPIRLWGWRLHPFQHWWFSPSVDLFAVTLRMLLFGLLAAVLVLAAPSRIGRIERRVVEEPWKSGLVGLLAQLLFLPLLVLTIVILVVSIIGIPLLLLMPFALLALLFALLIGFAGVAVRLGRWVQERLGLAPQGRHAVLVLGLAAIWVLTLVGHLIALGGWPIWGLAAMFTAVGFLVEYIAWTVGFGAALLTRFGTRPAVEVPAAAPEPPPEPAAPGDAPLTDLDFK